MPEKELNITEIQEGAEEAAQSRRSASGKAAEKPKAKKKPVSAKFGPTSGTVYDYLAWRGDISFAEMPPNEVDGLIFSLIAYIEMEGIVDARPGDKKPRELLAVTKKYLKLRGDVSKNLGLMIPRETVLLLVRASKTARFGLTRLICYENKICDIEQKQFSAVTFLLPGGDVFVAFRGTDDTIVGWKENFNMSFMRPVPSQLEAVEYVEKIAALTEGRIYMGGHSKGGNLAMYASVCSSPATRKRIEAVYNNDGPGFDVEFVNSPEYIEASAKIKTLVPQSSVIGMLLEHTEPRTVIKSSQTGLYQHNGLTWEVMGGRFIHLEETDSESRNIDHSLKEWLASLDSVGRERYFDTLYEALTSANARTLTELSIDKLSLLKAWGAMDSEARGYLTRCINAMMGKPPKPPKKEARAADEASEAEEAAEAEERNIKEAENEEKRD